MASILEITTAAEDLSLLTVDELRFAVGLGDDNSQDQALTALGARVAARLTETCNIIEGGIVPATLREETLTETFLMQQWGAFHHTPITSHWWRNPREQPTTVEGVMLSRRPITSVVSVTEAGVELDPTDFQIMATRGELVRLLNGLPISWWRGQTLVVVYTAGWPTVPENLKAAAGALARMLWFEAGRDPSLREVNIPGVVQRQYWQGSATEPAIPQSIMDMLRPYRNVILA